MHCIILIVFYALYSILCIVFYALYHRLSSIYKQKGGSLPVLKNPVICIIFIVFNALYAMHCILCIGLWNVQLIWPISFQLVRTVSMYKSDKNIIFCEFCFFDIRSQNLKVQQIRWYGSLKHFSNGPNDIFSGFGMYFDGLMCNQPPKNL
jgi:hypothetical protein